MLRTKTNTLTIPTRLSAYAVICFLVAGASGCKPKTDVNSLLAKGHLQGSSADLRERIEPFERTCERPFEITDVKIETVTAWPVNDGRTNIEHGRAVVNDDTDIMNFDVTFQVSGRFAETLYAEIDFPKITRQSENVRRQFHESLERLRAVSPDDARRLESAEPPLRRKARLFQTTCRRGDECRFHGTCVAQRDGLSWRFSKIALKAVEPAGCLGCKYRLTGDGLWVRDREGQAPWSDDAAFSFKASEWFPADQYHLDRPAVTQLPADAVLVDTESEEFNAPETRLDQLRRESFRALQDAKTKQFEMSQRAAIRFRDLDSKVCSFVAPDVGGNRRSFLIEFKFYEKSAFAGIALCRLANQPFARRAYHFRDAHSAPKLEFGPTGEFGPGLFGTENFRPGYFTEVAFEVVIREPNDFAIRIRGEEFVLKVVDEKSTLMSPEEAKADVLAKTSVGNRWLGTSRSADGKVSEVALTITNGEHSPPTVNAILEFPGTPRKPLRFLLVYNDYYGPSYADWPVMLHQLSIDSDKAKNSLQLYIDGESLAGQFDGDEIRFTKLEKLPIGRN